MPDLILVFSIGLLGSAHCIGMCGGFVLTLMGQQNDTRLLWRGQAYYFLGKTATYTLMGAIVGGTGAVIGSLFGGFQNLFSILIGLILIGVGLGLLGLLRPIRLFGINRLPGLGFIKRGFSYFMRRKTAGGAFGIGLVNGLLPCGLVYALLGKAAATGSVTGGALTMAVFGVATIPALFVFGQLGWFSRPIWRIRLYRLSGVMIIVFGLVTVFRGVSLHDKEMHMPEQGMPHQSTSIVDR